jgi:orotate phosphoribosyltransferase
VTRRRSSGPGRRSSRRPLDASYLEDFLLRSGRRSKFYLDKYLFSAAGPAARHRRRPRGKLPAYEPSTCSRPQLGAVAIVAAVSLPAKPFVIVRKGAKGYGTDKAMEGKAESGQKVVMIEDVVTSGGAALMAADKLREAGLEVGALLCVVDRKRVAGADRGQGPAFDPLFPATSWASSRADSSPRSLRPQGVSARPSGSGRGDRRPVRRGRSKSP